MSTFSFNKSGNDTKSNTLGSMNRQNVIQETNKRRTLLKDSSWIKNQPEEDVEKIRDENYGKNVLSRYKSQDNLDRDNQKEDTKPIHNRFKSDDALDRIPLRNTSERGNKSATLERFPMSETETTNKSRQSWAPSNNTTMTTTTTDESKRKSWGPTSRNTTITTTTTTSDTKPVVPGKPEGQKITIYSSDTRTTDKPTRSNFIDSARSKFEKVESTPMSPTSPTAKKDTRVQNFEEKPKLPPRSPVVKYDDSHSSGSDVYPSYTDVTKPTSNTYGQNIPSNSIKTVYSTSDQASYSTKPAIPESGDRRSAVDRKQRSQDLDNLIEVSSTRAVSSKGTQDINNLIDIKPTADKGKKSDPLDNLIEISSTARTASRSDPLDNLIEISSTARTASRSDPLDNLIEISSTARNASRSDGDLDSMIDIKKPDIKTRDGDLNKMIEIKKPDTKTRTQNLDNLIDVKSTTSRVNKGSQDLDDLIAITGDGNKGSANVTNRSSTTTRTYNVTDSSQDGPSRRSATTTTYKVTDDSQDAPSRRSTTTTYKGTDYSAPTRRSTNSYEDSIDGTNSVSNVTITQQTRYSPVPDVYPSYTDVTKPTSNIYGQNIPSNSIKTVYSTSDRFGMEKDICTYCRKPLGIDAKMILKDMNICCHATCFKCEACSSPLGNMKAGDSMWIYKQTIHCEPCYFSAREKWII